jgi:hypothetical protein
MSTTSPITKLLPTESGAPLSTLKEVTKEDVQSVDIIVQTAKEIGALDKASAIEIVPSLMESVDFSYFKLGGVLSAIQDNGWWEGSAPTFKAFIQDSFGLHYRKAMYLINIYNGLVEANIPWDKVSGLGWTKLKELADILTTENVDWWVAQAESLSTLNLIEAVKAAKSVGLSADGTTAPEVAGVSTITFKVHPDQKETIQQAIAQALEEANTEFKGVALEALCMNYLAGGTTKKVPTPSLISIMEASTLEDVFDAFEVVFPEVDITAEVG